MKIFAVLLSIVFCTPIQANMCALYIIDQSENAIYWQSPFITHGISVEASVLELIIDTVPNMSEIGIRKYTVTPQSALTEYFISNIIISDLFVSDFPFKLKIKVIPISDAQRLPLEIQRSSQLCVMETGNQNDSIVDSRSPGVDDLVIPDVEPRFDYPQLAKRIVYPEIARRNGIMGNVLAAVLIGSQNNIEKIRILNRVTDELDRSALKAISLTEFYSAQSGGKGVKMWVRIPVNFTLR